jgi:Tn3 transposase DDE domain
MEVLATVNRHTGWMEEFEHWQQRHHHGRPADRVVYAGVIGIGCTIGIRKMARISHPISESELENAVNWLFSVDNINAASDRVLQLMDRLELPKLLQRTPGRSHTSSDGQKFEVRVDSLNANHSFKYFGKEQGVSVYTFRDERDLLWHSLVFSAADRESAYVIDGLMHNEVVKSDIHSMDAFGYTEAIFATSHLTGFSYAPRFKNLKRHGSTSSAAGNPWIVRRGKLSRPRTAMSSTSSSSGTTSCASSRPLNSRKRPPRISSAGSIPIQSSTGCITP